MPRPFGTPFGTVSLERALSKLGALSRTDARRAILAGRVSVAGRVELDPSAPVAPETGELGLDGVPLQAPAARRVILLHKPRGVLTTRRDPAGRRTIYDVLPGELAALVPVGRLDLASTGLLLLTNDTRLADWLTDPRHGVPRTYLVTVRGRLADATARAAEVGIADDGESLAARRVVVRKASGRETHLVVELVGGKNREIRRLFAALGHEVTKLKRVAFGGLELGNLAPGGSREVTASELADAFPGAPAERRPRGA